MLIIYLSSVLFLSAAMLVNRNPVIRNILPGLFLAVQAALTLFGFLHIGEQDAGGNFCYDPLGLLFLSVLTILGFTTFLHSRSYLQHRDDSDRNRRLYLAAVMMLIGAMSAVYLSATLGIMWVLIEITTLSVAVLIYHERSHLALEATWKYVFICTIGITFAFVGIVFLSKALQVSGSVNLSFSDIPYHLQGANVFWLKLAFIFMLVGFSTKMGLFPMHTITVDAHTVAPPPISALISTTLMNAGFVAIFRTYTMMSHAAIYPLMKEILLWSGGLSVFVSAAYILKANHLKRMFAYSSLEHMGITAIGLASGGMGAYAAVLHIILHSFVKSGVFYQIDQVHRVFRSYLLSRTGNYFNLNFAGALVMLLVFVSITAIPPSGMFISEFLIFISLFEGRHWIAFVFTLVMLTLIMFALGRNILLMLFAKPSGLEPDTRVTIRSRESASQFLLLILAMCLGFFPPTGFVTLIRESIALLP